MKANEVIEHCKNFWCKPKNPICKRCIEENWHFNFTKSSLENEIKLQKQIDNYIGINNEK